MIYICCLLPNSELNQDAEYLDLICTQPMAFSMYSGLLREAGKEPPILLTKDTWIPLVATWEIQTEVDSLRIIVMRGEEW
jgi:hypothetical protein